MKTKITILACCLAVSAVYAQYPGGGTTSSSVGGGQYSGPKPPAPPSTLLISTIAGNGTDGYAGDGGQATAAELNLPTGTVLDALGNLYIADQENNRIRKITTAGIISTVVGNGTAGYSGDGGQATAAELYYPFAVTFNASGNLYIADQFNNVIRKVTTAGIISTIAGTGTFGYSGDGGQATAAELDRPGGIVFDGSGNLYIADWLNSVIRKVTTAGIISTIAGTGTEGYLGDGGQATAAELARAISVVFDSKGNLYIGDEANAVIRMINTAGIISTYAGTGTQGYSGDGGAATAADLSFPCGLTIDANGTIYIADRDNNVIRFVNTSGTIWTWAGNGTAGNTGDCGSAGSAELNTPLGVTIDPNGNIYISDGDNNKIRKLWATNTTAGNNQTNYESACGSWLPGVTIGTAAMTGIERVIYSWSPTTALSCTNCAQPTCTLSTTSSSLTVTYTLTVTVEGCTATTSTVQVTAVKSSCAPGCCRLEGISSFNAIPQNFVVYPNPATGQVTLSLYDRTDYIHIFDMQGRLVYETKDIGAGDFLIDISQYSKGIYFVMAKIGNSIERKKLVVE